MSTKTFKDAATGKVVVVHEEGNRETRFSPVQDCRQIENWQQVYETVVGEFSEGQIEVSVQVQSHALAEWSAIEVRVVGYVGPIRNVLVSWMLGGGKTTGRLPLEQGDTYDRLAVEARPIVNGVPGPGAMPPQAANLNVALKMWA